ncbi:MAG TPA: TonB-dependent receptor [Kiritimatiellia bacterium]|jgi:iron complex outermembrane receptor protein|nr:TonB-dependent receptor [Kiritimatiellia bacterium]HOR98566.1 TonB-dependent receptor [Kiritimatiellia bacterium]HPK37607.1 TonB-dependent receptor [Kiritimatiellia bacterium]HPW74518.1 TonB-dependent receptor [Kiritimatiellia bacterium]HRU19981.1 TonB-dependent receptor [Kiritimatiellia bacterium]
MLTVFRAPAQTAVSNVVILIEATPLASLVRPGPEPLRDIPGLMLRQQGASAPQGDLSIRGSPFNGAGLLLNGLTLRNAQTEHWHADLSVPNIWTDTPTVLTGMERFRAASGHPSGSVSLELAPLSETLRSITLGGGDKGALFGQAVFTETEPFRDGVAGASAFVSADRADQTDGYRDNDLVRGAAGARIHAANETMRSDLVTALSWREFGARGFYGTDPSFPAAERKGDALAAGSLRFVQDPRQPARLSAAWLRTRDTYWLDRHNRTFYENDHTTDFFVAHGDTRRTFNDTVSVDLRADGDLETLESRSLGNHTRSHASLAVLPNLTCGPLTWTVGGALDLFSTDSPIPLPAAGVEWTVSERHTLFLSYTAAARQPSYTELNYESPSSLGNAGLDRQRTQTAELGWKAEHGPFRWRTVLFHEEGRNIVDWRRTSPAGRWQAVNLETLRTTGLAAEGVWEVDGNTDFGLNLLTVSKDTDTSGYASRYALDYPRAAADACVRHRLTRELSLRLSQGVSRYATNHARQHDNWFWDTRAGVQWQPRQLPGLTLNAGIDNLLDDDFQIFPGQETAGRCMYVSLTHVW